MEYRTRNLLRPSEALERMKILHIRASLRRAGHGLSHWRIGAARQDGVGTNAVVAELRRDHFR